MANQEEKNEPSFIDQAFAIIEESYSRDGAKDEHGMTIADHKLLCRVLNAHENYIDENIVKKFVAEIAEHYKPIMKSQERLEKGMMEIAKDIREIKKWQEETEERLGEEETKSKGFIKKIKTLEEQMATVNPEQVAEFIRLMQKFGKTQRWWNIALRIALAVIITMIIGYFTFPTYHKRVLENPDGTPKTGDSKMNDLKQKHDMILIRQIRSGNEVAFQSLVNKYKEQVYITILGMVKNTMDAEDLSMEVFMKIYLNINKYTPEYTFRTWLSTVIKNHTLDWLKRQRLKLDDLDTVKSQRSSSYNPEEILIHKENISRFNNAVDQLDQKYKRIIMLRNADGYSYRQISEELNLSMNLVTQHILRARNSLYKLLIKNTLQ